MAETDAEWRRLWRRILLTGVALIAVVAGLGALIGYLVAGLPGVWGALVGGGLTAAFVGISAVVMYLGRNWSVTMLAGGLGLGFALKVLLFMLVVPRLAAQETIYGPVAFFTIVAAVIGSTALEAMMFQKARIPYVDPDAGR